MNIEPVKMEVTRKELLNAVKALNGFQVWFHSELDGDIGMVINGVAFPIKTAIESANEDYFGDLGRWDIQSLKQVLGM